MYIYIHIYIHIYICIWRPQNQALRKGTWFQTFVLSRMPQNSQIITCSFKHLQLHVNTAALKSAWPEIGSTCDKLDGNMFATLLPWSSFSKSRSYQEKKPAEPTASKSFTYSVACLDRTSRLQKRCAGRVKFWFAWLLGLKPVCVFVFRFCALIRTKVSSFCVLRTSPQKSILIIQNAVGIYE